MAVGGVTARVLVVNDDFDAAEVLARAVAAEGHGVGKAHDGDGAIAALTADGGFDVAVVDLSKGGASANNRLLEAIRASAEGTARAVRVIVVGSSPAAALSSWQRGADGHLVRPFHINDLLTMLADVVTRDEDQRADHRDAEQRRLIGAADR